MTDALWQTFIIGGLVLAAVFAFARRQPAEASESVAAARSCPKCGSDAPDDAAACQCGYMFQTEAPTSYDVSKPQIASAPDSAGSEWTVWGWILTLGGIAGLGFSLFMEISVETYVPSSILGAGGSSEVVNLGLIFNKGVAVACSLSGIGLGVFCFAVAAMLKAIGGRAE